MTWIKKLHWQIVLSLGLGLIYGILATKFGWAEFTDKWISPFGTIFINLLKLSAVPLVIVSLICGVASLSDTSKLGQLGGKTIAAYMATTAAAIIIGLIVANVAGFMTPPLDEEVRQNLINKFSEKSGNVIASAESVSKAGPLQSLVDIVPDNFFASVSNNRNMLQIVFLSIFLGCTMVIVGKRASRPLLDFFTSLNECLITAVRLIIKLAPIGVFSLLSTAITSAGGDVSHIVGALTVYGLTVVVALIIHAAVVYPAIIHFMTPMSVVKFFKAIWPAQTFAFSTSSSAATLPITMERCRNGLGVSEEKCSFILPLGATINMDGTALYQAVATIFLANAMGIPLGIGGQISILMIALLASIGTAAVPSAGMVMLVVILEQTKIPAEAIGLIWALDRPLDMLRTAVNVTGDATVATLISRDDLARDLDFGSNTGARSQENNPQRNRRPNRNRRRPAPGNNPNQSGRQNSGSGNTQNNRRDSSSERERSSQGEPRRNRDRNRGSSSGRPRNQNQGSGSHSSSGDHDRSQQRNPRRNRQDRNRDED